MESYILLVCSKITNLPFFWVGEKRGTSKASTTEISACFFKLELNSAMSERRKENYLDKYLEILFYCVSHALLLHLASQGPDCTSLIMDG